MQRILVVLPFYGGSLPIGYYCAQALKDLGCLVEIFESPDFFSAFSAFKNLKINEKTLDYLENGFLQVISNAILAKVESFKPDLVLCMAQAPISRQALKRLKKDNVLTAMWFMENHKLFTYWRSYAPYYDFFAIIQKEPFMQELKNIGVQHPLYLPMAALPSIHKPLELTLEEQKEYSAEVSFLGAGYPNRRSFFPQLVGKDFKIWGTEWEGEPRLTPYIQRQGSRISSEDAVKIYNATTINLNLHSSVFPNVFVEGGDFVNPRTFELASSGAFQLVDERTLMDELFAPDELVRFNSIDDLKSKIRHYINHPEERKAVVEKSRTRVLQDHQYIHRMKTLLDYIKSAVPQFGEHKEPDSFSLLSSEMRAELSSLLKQMQLPYDANFDDIITALTSSQGKLADVEIALLFLNEWKKLYVD